MKLKICAPLLLFLFICSCATPGKNKDAKTPARGSSVKCMENSPERRGEEGCTILADRLLVGAPTKTPYWHSGAIIVIEFDPLPDDQGTPCSAHLPKQVWCRDAWKVR